MNKKLRSLLKAQISMYVPKRLPGFLKKLGPVLLMGPALLIGLFVLYYAWMFEITGILSSENIIMIVIMIVTMMTVVFGISVAKGHLFSFSDYNLLMSLPIKKSELFIVKLFSYLIYTLSIYIIGLLPSFIYIGITNGSGIDYYLFGTLTIIISSLVPSLIAIFLAILLRKLSGNGKHQRLIENLFNVLLLVVVFGVSMNLVRVEDMEDLNFVGDIIGRSLPFIKAYADIIFRHNIINLLILTVVSITVGYVLVNFLSKTFIRLNEMANVGYKTKDYKGGGIKSSGRIMALYKMEFKRFLKNFMYFLNTCIFGVMLYIGVIYLLFNQDLIKEMTTAISMLGNSDIVYSFTVLMLCIFAIHTCDISAISISLEGKNLWILKSSPLSPKDVFLAKGLVNFTVAMIIAIVPYALLSVILGVNLLYVLTGVLILVLSAIFTSAYGLLINLLLPKLEFDREIVVIKQSASIMAALFSNFFIIFAIGFLLMYLNEITFMSYLILIIIYIILDIILFYLLNGFGVRKFRSL